MAHNHDVNVIADNLTQAIMSFDPELQRKVMAPNFTVWHNTDDITLDLDGAVAFLGNLGSKVSDVQYTDVKRVATEDGYVQEATVLATTNSGKSTKNYVVVVVKLDDEGRVETLREYQDSATFNPVLEG